jgi:mono/diheme cytochrome c family protein
MRKNCQKRWGRSPARAGNVQAMDGQLSRGTNMKESMMLIGVLSLALVTSALAAETKEVWEKNCASCHGKDGKGETKAGKKAEVKDLTDAKYQESFTDEKMLQQIKEGLKDKNGKEKMKPFGDKLSAEEINGLISYIRAFKK